MNSGNKVPWEAECRMEILKDPHNPKTWADLGSIYWMFKPEKAVDAFGTALLLAPDNADLWCNLGDAYRRLGLHDSALASYREAIRLVPGHFDSWLRLGHAYRKLKQPERSAQAYRNAVDLDAQSDQAWDLIATVEGNSTRH